MGYNYSMHGKSPQQQAIVRQKEREEALRNQQADKLRKQSKLRYAILKELEKGNQPTEETFGLKFGEYMLTLSDLQKEGYISRVVLSKTHIFLEDAVVTEKGEEYLLKNSALTKTYAVAKEIKEWIKL